MGSNLTQEQRIKGGRNCAAARGRAHMQAIGRRGGCTTVARHGAKHMSRIGHMGLKALAAAHFGGDRKAALAWLIAKGLHTQNPLAPDGSPINGAWPDPGPLPEAVR